MFAQFFDIAEGPDRDWSEEYEFEEDIGSLFPTAGEIKNSTF